MFYCDREALARDGGDSGRWYIVRIDPREGRVIDETTPDGTYRTMTEAKDALLFMYRRSPS